MKAKDCMVGLSSKVINFNNSIYNFLGRNVESNNSIYAFFLKINILLLGIVFYIQFGNIQGVQFVLKKIGGRVPLVIIVGVVHIAFFSVTLRLRDTGC